MPISPRADTSFSIFPSLSGGVTHRCGSLDVIRSCLPLWMVSSDSFRFSVVHNTADITIYYIILLLLYFNCKMNKYAIINITIGWSETSAVLSEQASAYSVINTLISKLPMADRYNLPCCMNDMARLVRLSLVTPSCASTPVQYMSRISACTHK